VIAFANLARGSALFLSVLIAIGGGTASSADAQVPAKGATFGDKPSFQSTPDIAFSLSEDKKAFTILFSSALEASVGSPASANAPNPPVDTKTFSIVLPVSGEDIDTEFVVSTFVIATEGAQAALVLAVNDKTTVMQVPYATNGEPVLVRLKYQAKTTSDVRINLFLLAQRDQAHPNAAATLHIDAIDTDLAAAQARADKRKKT
jgi:hypothetical protein